MLARPHTRTHARTQEGGPPGSQMEGAGKQAWYDRRDPNSLCVKACHLNRAAFQGFMLPEIWSSSVLYMFADYHDTSPFGSNRWEEMDGVE